MTDFSGQKKEAMLLTCSHSNKAEKKISSENDLKLRQAEGGTNDQTDFVDQGGNSGMYRNLLEAF